MYTRCLLLLVVVSLVLSGCTIAMVPVEGAELTFPQSADGAICWTIAIDGAEYNIYPEQVLQLILLQSIIGGPGKMTFKFAYTVGDTCISLWEIHKHVSQPMQTL